MENEARGADRYEGTAGEEYFAWQAGIGDLGGELDRWKFEQFIGPNDTVADFGCGGGFLLAKLNCARRVGIELNPRARTHAESLGIEVHVSCAGIAADSVDIVVSNHALEHVSAPHDALRELHRITRRGGAVVCVVPYEGWLLPDPFVAGDINQHLYAWTPATLGNLFEAAGFNVVTSEVLWSAWTPEAWKRWGKSPRIYRALCWYLAIRRRAPQLRVVARKR